MGGKAAGLVDNQSQEVTTMVKELFQVDVEIDLAKNQKIRGMFKNNDLGEEMVLFLLENKIDIAEKNSRAGNVNRISLRGSPEGLNNFVRTYFTADETPVVYNLKYL
jgi:hypothetical protein